MMANLFVSVPLTVFVVWCISFVIKKFAKHEIILYLLRILALFVTVGALEGFFSAKYHSLLWIVALGCIWFGFQTLRKSPSFLSGLVSLVLTIAASFYAYTLAYSLFFASHWSWGGALLILVVMFSFYFIFPFFNSSNRGYTSSSSSRSGSSRNNTQQEDSSAERNRQFDEDARRQTANTNMHSARRDIDGKKSEISRLYSEISSEQTKMEYAARRSIDTTYSESLQRADISGAERCINDCQSKIRSLESDISSLEREAEQFEREARS